MNKVEKFFIEMAIFYKISIDHRWKRELINKIGAGIGIKTSNNINNWINAGFLPKHRISKLISLDIPDELKALCESCGKEKKISKEEAKKQIREVRNKKQLKHEEVIALFQDQASALELNLDLVELEKTDKRKYDYVRGLVRGFVLDARPKKNANHS